MNWPILFILVWFGGFGILKMLAAKAVASETGKSVLAESAFTGWLRGRSTAARVYRNIAILWLILGAALFIVWG